MTSGHSASNASRAPLSGLAPDWAATLITATSEVALVVDRGGIIRHVEFSGAEPPVDGAESWVGTPWVDTVTPESRGKIEQMLREATTAGTTRRRQVNHPSRAGADIPVAYNAVRAEDGSVVAVGRDLRAISTLQQRLVDTQQAMERDYWKLRHVETRYRLLFQLSTDAIIVVDADTMKVVDASNAATRLFDLPAEKLVGRSFPLGIAVGSARAMEDLLAAARTTGHAGDVRITLADGRGESLASASCFRQENLTLLLVRLSRFAAPAGVSATREQVLALVQMAPDACVITDADGAIVYANRAFLDLAQLASEEQAKARSLGNWVGRPGADLQVFLSTLKKHGVVRVAASSVRGDLGLSSEIELSAVTLADGGIGFILRDVGRRVATVPHGARDLTKAVEDLTALVGRVSLPTLVKDTTDLVERHFIEAALELTGDNRTTAAEVLGLSRQTLYVKLRRHGLSGGDTDTAEAI
ncbi:MAG: transcriptional regulator PpsR [Gemmatimonadota bacterium]|nr:transcriptional regulator PpsR [Gemmatimonadota bacterium]MDQ8147198.1 transcriptional regulator PpsR [Gemmatimonadota bacterium]MDQ8149050.1 transcriptional regulator PpsR [Gemmatimonadota bacterium]MDQ8170734.1 transcriptional regulator PpsR [Gemmatimonadota bacterium]MDQ8176611.1 transcriptional regulator PpsR [Gemmatimonadota bacterium]